MIVVDTTVLVDYLRGHEDAGRALEGALADEDAVVGSVLTRV